jgi:cytochrome c oxidase subunit II
MAAGGVKLSRSRYSLAPGNGSHNDDQTQGTGAVMQMPVFSRLSAYAAAVGALVAGTGAALAGIGQPSPWELGLQEAGSPVMADIISFHNFLLWIITAITAFVLVLLLIVMIRYSARANPTPSRTTHNAVVEIIWTIVPVIILVAIAIPSFRLLFVQLDNPTPDLTIKATGKQWYWSYNYPDNGNFEFDSLIVEDKDLKPGQPRLLTVDSEMVVPVNKVVHVLVTGADVIHSFAVPSFGIKIDAVPGRLNDTWFKATSEGLFHGQCSELCGKDHAFMPITVRVVNDAEFAAWIATEKKNAGLNSAAPTAVAAAGAAR